MHEERVADAAVASPPDDAADARPEAAVMERPAVPLRSGPHKGVGPYQALGLKLIDGQESNVSGMPGFPQDSWGSELTLLS